MAEITSDAVIGFAKQGHPQAIAVLLNRALVPKGAHVKVRQKKELLKILINFLRETELDQLVSLVQETFNNISPENVQRVQIFTQRLGDRQAAFQKEIAATSGKAHSKVTKKIDVSPSLDVPVTPRPPLTPVASKLHGATAQASEPSDPCNSDNRYSVTEFLSQVTSVEELDVLKDHPFFTGVCPHCSHGYASLENPPLFWDCVACGWKDDLSQKVPSHLLRETPQRRKISQGKRLGSYLIEAGLLTPAQIEVALADQQLAGIRLGEVLVRRGWIKEETVEYFMRKVVEPERQASTGPAEAYLESSRNLFKTLMESQTKSPQDVADDERKHNQVAASTPVKEDLKEKELLAEKNPPASPINDKATLILSDLDPASVKTPANPAQAVNERETLLLPDLDVHQFMDKDSNS